MTKDNFKEDNFHLFTDDEIYHCMTPVWKFVADNDERCVDNYRMARCSNSAQMRRYRRQQANGCCGSFDEVVEMWNIKKMRFEKYLVGCNYGH